MRSFSCPDAFSPTLTRLLAVAVVAVVLTAANSSFQELPRLDLIVVQVPAEVPPNSGPGAPLEKPAHCHVDGSRIMLLPASGSEPINLTQDFVAACDPDVSFDGSSIIFSGRRTQDDPFQIWIMDADGSNKVQITRDLVFPITPVFAGSRFYLNDSAPTPQVIFAAAERSGGTSSLYGTDIEGETVRRLTFNLLGDYSPDVLPNGRIVFSSVQDHGNSFSPRRAHALLAVNLDGTDLMPYYGNHEPPRFKGMVHVSDLDERVYFVEADSGINPLAGGDIAVLSQRRPLHSYRKVAHDPLGYYHSPVPLPDGSLLASHRGSDPDAVYGLYRLDPESGERIGQVFEEPGWHTIDAQILMPHQTPKGKSNWLIPGSTTGVFYSLNSYRTNLGQLEELAPGTVKHVRVIEGVPAHNVAAEIVFPPEADLEATSMLLASGLRRLLGVAPVEEDGSFHIRVPAETPITFQLLDENYVARRTQTAWTWVMGNENRGCIGCHEDRELSPPNAMVDAVVKPPVELTLPPERRRTVDFKHQIAPILASRCATAGCHVPNGAAPNLSFEETDNPGVPVDDSYRTYEVFRSLVEGRDGRRYVIPGRAKDSPLIWSLFGRRLNSEHGLDAGVVSQMPREPLSLRERIQMIEWVDLGAYWDSRPAPDEDPFR